MTAVKQKKKVNGALPFRRSRGPQAVGLPAKFNPLSVAHKVEGEVVVRLKLPRTTTARGVRRAHARLIEYVLAGLLDSLVATRLSFILENIRKAIETEQIAGLQAKLDELKAEGARYGVAIPWESPRDALVGSLPGDLSPAVLDPAQGASGEVSS
jgi:hypothetical protein